MIYNFYFASLIFLAGFCLFSALYHLTAEQSSQQRRVHLLFAGIVFLMVLGTMAAVINYNTSNVADYIPWVRINVTFNIAFFALLPWFFAIYSGVRPKLVLVGSAAICALLFYINLTQPYSILYSEIHGIVRLLLPWGEEVFLLNATPSIWGKITSAYLLLVPTFAFYVLVKCYRRDRRRSTLNMMFAVALLMASMIQVMIVRVMGIHNLPPLGSFGFMGMVIIMGTTLTHELRKSRKLAEAALQQSERKARAILDQSIHFIGLVSTDGTLLDANRAALELVGLHPHDVINKPLWESPWWNHSTELQNKLRESILLAASGEDVRFEANHPTIDGSLCYVDFTLRPVKNEQGDIIYLIPEGHDITDRKHAEKALQESEKKYRDIVENAPMGIFKRELGGKFHYVNPGLIRQLECKTEKELLDNYGLISQRWVSPQKSDEFNSFLLKNRRVEGFETESRLVDGTTKWFSLYSLLDDSDQFINGFSLDITERKFAERALSSLATNFAGLSGKAFFEAASKHIATEMGIDYVYVGALTDTKDSVQVLGGFALGEAMGEMLYSLTDTPCSDVIENDSCMYPTGIQQHYPKDYLLQQMGIDSYLGNRIYNKEQEPIGLLVALHSKPFNNPEILGNLFSIFLDRITAEMHRMNAYETLHKNEAIQRKMVSNIGDVIVIIDENGINRYKSLNIEKWFGWKPEEVIGKSTWDNVHPDDLLNGKNFLDSIISEPNASGTIELRYRKKDDSYCWIEITIINLLHDSDICGLLGNYHDITERKKADAILKKLYTAIDYSNASIVITDALGNIEFANPYFSQLTGYSEDDYLGKNPSVLKSGIHSEEFYKTMWNTIKSGNTWEGEFCNRKKNGELYWEKSIITPIKNEKEKILNFVAVKSDITNEKKHKQLDDITLETHEKSEYLTVEEILKLSTEFGIQLSNSEIGFFHFVNEDQKTISLQAWSAKTMEMRDVPKLDMQYPISKAGVWVDCFYMKKPVFHNDYSSLSHKKELLDGYSTLIRVLSVPVIVENQVVAIFSVGNKETDYNDTDAEFLTLFAENVWNVIRRKNAELNTIKAKEKAEESDHLKTAFLENISHEVRTPMNAILGFSNLMLEPGINDVEKKQYSDILQKSTNQLLSIIDNTITLAHIETNQIQLNRMSFCPKDMLSKLLNEYTTKKQLAEKSTIEIILTIHDKTDCIITNDYTRINQIVDILLDNALKFTYSGTIEFGYYLTENRIVFYVKDTGIGIPDSKQQIIFKSFAQADNTIRQTYGGLGVGLSIALGLINLLDGELKINSHENRGTEILFSLPL